MLVVHCCLKGISLRYSWMCHSIYARQGTQRACTSLLELEKLKVAILWNFVYIYESWYKLTI
ncbi:hypothetical protein Goklo_020840 [Gossypium klotzschianum]|uniref:Uncharacterized protein n=1 Tax=Gossypium klotzschianum TaxID=34286 RepID=A0A7J8UT84_9ROSI|nr:hypothetical protein [Gossypium klotzschianum]